MPYQILLEWQEQLKGEIQGHFPSQETILGGEQSVYQRLQKKKYQAVNTENRSQDNHGNKAIIAFELLAQNSDRLISGHTCC